MKFSIIQRKIPRVSALLAIGGIFLLTILLSIRYHIKRTSSLSLKPTPITSQYLYQSKSKGFAIYLGNRSSEQIPDVKFAVENSSIEFTPDNSLISDNSYSNSHLLANSNSVTYKNIYPNVDLRYSLIQKGIKEEIVIRDTQYAIRDTGFNFKLNLQNAVPQKDLMNEMAATTFVDPISGKYLFHFEKPFMVDAGGNRSEQVKMEIQRASASDSASFRIVLIPDQNWLKTALFPVIIDPTVVSDNADTVADWASSNSTFFTPSQDTGDKQEGTGSIQVAASSVKDDVFYFLKTLGVGDTTIATKYANIDLEMDVKEGNQTISADTSWGNATADTRMLGVRVNGNLTIDAGKTLTATTRKRGMAIYVTGDLNLNGTISMTARGANAAGQQVLLLNDGTEYQVAAAGGAGGARASCGAGGEESWPAGTAGATGATGGGGSGRTRCPTSVNWGTGGGGAGTSYSGGAGGGASGTDSWGGQGGANGGAGGNGGATYGGGGAGNPAGSTSGSPDSQAVNGTGGLLMVFVGGNLTIGSTGMFSSNGSNGAVYGTGYHGGGSGGGSVNVFYKGTLTGYSSSKVTANGGWGWSSGGTGTTRIYQSSLSTDALNATLTKDLGGGTKDLTGYSSVTFWIKSTRTGTYLQFGIGESAWDNNTTNIIINSANTWEEKTLDISGISNADKDAIRYLGFKVTNADTDFTMKFDDIKSVNLTPTSPTSLLAEGQTNPSDITNTTPDFSAIYNDPDSGDTANKYQVQVDDDPVFGSPIWDSGSSGTAMSNCNQGNRCSDITYGGNSTDLQWNTRYYWRIKYWDDSGEEGVWSTESAYFTMSPIYEPTSCLVDDGGKPSATILKWNDNTNLETAYRIERSVDNGAYSLLSSEAANTVSYNDNTTLGAHIYFYRVRAESANGNSQWCGSSQADYSKGNLQMQGILVR